MRALSMCIVLGAPLAGCAVQVRVFDDSIRPAAVSDRIDWKQAEKGILENHRQLTFADRFVKAGEAYFSPDDSRIIFQAVGVPPAGEAADEFYAMFIADLVRDDAGRITGLDDIIRISPPGSANTCGWFHPTDPNEVIFASTIGPPSEATPPGFERLSGRYRWMFPREMKIVRCRLDTTAGAADSLDVLLGDDQAYQAECTLSRDARHLLFCSMESNRGDLFVKDLLTGRLARIVQSQAYDGGPFFSPDGRRICFRADRGRQHYLQLFVGELAFNEDGTIVALNREYQLTDNEHVNWAPFWHPNSRYLVYATSEVGHHNYEVFVLDADGGDVPGSTGTIKYGTRRRRITHASGADILPAFNSDGTTMMWTSQRGDGGKSQLWVADFVIDLESKRTSNDADHSSN
ncbi:MAG: PD40 domain-containing protein [Planctomycetes bacterium]|nr:PD40 domain-containing protein [Planctomycetota bacterium]